ncbi:YjbH domain-containing protein [Vibrio sp. 10N.261.51.F12]|uniref:YjbH domain-containing protein n=1 Tax=Vibrio sp. 10N.261.51.F12 TaxID=3229679 RepID=UPI003553AB87
MNKITASLPALAVLSLSISAVLSSSVSADPFEPATLTPSQSDFGGVGLMQMPTGRMAREGEFSINGNWNNDYHKYNVSLQLMPWLETTIRYTIVQGIPYSNDPSFSGDTDWADKGIDFKVRLWQETDYLPETSVGFRDFGGTGLFDGEFVAATKRYENFDFTLGMGWGYLGTRDNIPNPFCQVSDGFCERPTDGKSGGGQANYDRWFRGPAALFGGIEYQTPWQPLRFKLEYDSNDYSQDAPHVQGHSDMTPATPWNVGVLYRLGNWGDARASYERGNTLALGVTLRTNFNDMKAVWLDEPEVQPRPNDAVTKLQDVDWPTLANQLESNAGYKDATIAVEGDKAIISASQNKYRDRAQAQERAAAILSSTLPANIKTYEIVETAENIPMMSTTIDAKTYQTIALNQSIDENFDDAATGREEINLSDSTNKRTVYDGFNAFDYYISPTLAQSFGSAENFYLFEIGVDVGAEYWLTRNFNVSGGIHFSVVDNYDSFTYEVPPDGTDVPRVRTLFRSYVTDNPVRMNNLQLTWLDELGNGFYSQAYGGYLESMFAGAGGEVLYRPLNQNWAIGADVNLVSQRDPDSWFGVFTEEQQYSERDGRYYKVLPKGTTGFLTGYYMPEWNFIDNTLLKVGVGKFLAGDLGTRVDFSKQFDSGVIAGAYASFTNMSTEDFGEGSFTKGVYVSIPFDIMTVKPSANRANISWQPITRDGGQMLSRKYQLFNLTDARSPWLQRPSEVE